MSDWNPSMYLKFARERTQPSIDLTAAIEHAAPEKIIDIGCGPGNSTAVLRQRWQNAAITGLDSSLNMLKEARAKYPDINWVHKDATESLDSLGEFDIVFSNAAIQWIPDQPKLLSKLYNLLKTGGVLAVQVPYIKNMPINSELEKLAAKPEWRGYFDGMISYSQQPMNYYYKILKDFGGEVRMWETQYYHILPSHDDLVTWYSGSGLRVYFDCIQDERKKAEFREAFKQALIEGYTAETGGEVIFPFNRLFFTVKKEAKDT